MMKKSNLEVLFNVLKGTEGVLNLAESRRRDVYLKPVLTALETFYKDRNTIFEKFCTKKEDGTPDIHEEKYSFPPESLDELNKEIEVLLNETVEIPGDVKDLLEKSEYKPKIGEAEQIDELLK